MMKPKDNYNNDFAFWVAVNSAEYSTLVMKYMDFFFKKKLKLEEDS